MNARFTLLLVCTLAAAAAPAAAQVSEPTRTEDARDLRQARASATTPYQPGKVERVLTMLESHPLFLRTFAERDGFGIRVGGIEQGAGLAAGPSFRASNLLDARLRLDVSAAASIARDRDFQASIALPHIGHRLALSVGAVNTHLGNERFFGLGMGTARDDATAFAVDSTRLTARAAVTAGRLELTADAGTLRANAGNATGRRVPAIGTRFTTQDAPALGSDAAFSVLSMRASVDFRDVRDNPRRGGRYQVVADRYVNARQRHSFTRVHAELEQHLSAWKRQRLLTLRGVASTAVPDRGHEVPFYLQPTLGGARLLRGFVTDRFRGSTLVALQGEYGWDVSPFLNAVLFYETGAVAAEWRDLRTNTLRRDYGIGFRFGSARTVAFRTDVALGSGEGTRLTMRFNHAF